MRLVLAHEHDAAARALVARWRERAVLLTPTDLHRERWILRVDEGGTALACLPSRPDVTSVVCRLGGVGRRDLAHVRAEDLDYAAAELDAFLRAWLTAWAGPVANRPSTTCLNGPGWRPEQWVAAAAAVGITMRPVRREVDFRAAVPVVRAATPPAPDHSTDLARVTVVRDRWFGPVDEEVGRALCSLARAAGCVVLGAEVGGIRPQVAVGAPSAWPDVSAPEVADALAELLDGAA